MALRKPKQSETSNSVLSSPAQLSFGTIPVTVDPSAVQMLGGLPLTALSNALAAVRSWTQSGGVKRINAYRFQDPESGSAEEVVLEISVEGDTAHALARWRALSAAVDQAKAAMTEEERRILDRRLALHLAWGEDA